jgi:hypothetical protein
MRGEPGFRKTCLRTFEPANARCDAAQRAGGGITFLLSLRHFVTSIERCAGIWDACFAGVSVRVRRETVYNQVLCLDSREVHERARSHGQVLAYGIDEMPVTLEGESFDVQADQLRLFRF